jgi:hypothetical protein
MPNHDSLEKLEKWEKLVRALNDAANKMRLPEIWPGTERQLAAKIVDQYNKGEIQAPSARQAIIQTVSRYVIQLKDGRFKAINPDSIVRSYQGKLK